MPQLPTPHHIYCTTVSVHLCQGSHEVGTARAAAGSLEFNAGVRNALGRAERLDAAAEWGSKGSNEYSVALSQPRVGGRPITVETRIAQLFRNFTRHSSFTEQLRQAAVTVSTCVCSGVLKNCVRVSDSDFT